MAAAFEDRDTESLMNDGYAALREGRLDDAMTIAAALRRRRHSSCFEIEARARWNLGETETAISVLEEGVEKAPKASPLWHWLGTYRSDLGRYESALEAFEKEAEFEGVSPSASAYNVAVVYERMGRPAEALDLLDRIERPEPPGPSPAHFAELRARLLFDLGRFEDAIESSTDAINRFGGAAVDVHGDRALLGPAYAVRADARLASGDLRGAIEDAEASIDFDSSRAPRRALEVLRRAEGQLSPAARRYTLVLEGELPRDGGRGRLGFFVSMQVVADDPAEGVHFARRFVPEAARPRLAVAEVTDLGPAPESLKGIYSCGRLHSFDPNAAGEEPPEGEDEVDTK